MATDVIPLQSHPHNKVSLDRLKEIANALGVPVSAFLQGDGRIGVTDLDDTRELLKLWSAIKELEGRRLMLAAMRMAVPG